MAGRRDAPEFAKKLSYDPPAHNVPGNASKLIYTRVVNSNNHVLYAKVQYKSKNLSSMSPRVITIQPNSDQWLIHLVAPEEDREGTTATQWAHFTETIVPYASPYAYFYGQVQFAHAQNILVDFGQDEHPVDPRGIGGTPKECKDQQHPQQKPPPPPPPSTIGANAVTAPNKGTERARSIRRQEEEEGPTSLDHTTAVWAVTANWAAEIPLYPSRRRRRTLTTRHDTTLLKEGIMFYCLEHKKEEKENKKEKKEMKNLYTREAIADHEKEGCALVKIRISLGPQLHMAVGEEEMYREMKERANKNQQDLMTLAKICYTMAMKEDGDAKESFLLEEATIDEALGDFRADRPSEVMPDSSRTTCDKAVRVEAKPDESKKCMDSTKYGGKKSKGGATEKKKTVEASGGSNGANKRNPGIRMCDLCPELAPMDAKSLANHYYGDHESLLKQHVFFCCAQCEEILVGPPKMSEHKKNCGGTLYREQMSLGPALEKCSIDNPKKAYDDMKKMYAEGSSKDPELLWRLAKACYAIASDYDRKNPKKKELLLEGWCFADEAKSLGGLSHLKTILDLVATLGKVESIQRRIELYHLANHHLTVEGVENDASLLHMRGRYVYSMARSHPFHSKIRGVKREFHSPLEATIDEALRVDEALSLAANYVHKS